MSSYLTTEDSDSDEAEKSIQLSPEEREETLANITALKAEGNTLFSEANYESALEKYTSAINLGKKSGLPKDALILLNRSATYLALKRYVPALNDANQGLYK